MIKAVMCWGMILIDHLFWPDVKSVGVLFQFWNILWLPGLYLEMETF